MKWDIYKKFSCDDREEWNYRFKEQTTYKPISSNAIMYTIVLWSVMALFMMAYYLMITDKVPEATSSVTTDGLKVMSTWTVIIVLSYVIDVIINLASLFYYNSQAKKWLKEKGYI